jgi:hypothetical protein
MMLLVLCIIREIEMKKRTLLRRIIRIAVACAFFSIVACGDSMNGIYNMFGEHPYIFVTQSGSGDGSGSSWVNAATLQTAVNNARNGQEIWVRAGTYPANIPAGKEISLYGGFAGNEGSRDERDPASRHTIPQLTINSFLKNKSNAMPTLLFLMQQV